MRLRQRRRGGGHGVETALANYGLTLAKVMLAIGFASMALISKADNKDDGIRPKVEAVIMVDWPKEADADVDTWVRTPSHGIVYYGNKQSDMVFLDRDDLGNTCVTDCSEMVSLRKMEDGEYALSLNLYFMKDVSPGGALPAPLRVHIKVMRMNPKIKLAFEKDVYLTYDKQEEPVARFTIQDGEFMTFDDGRPSPIIPRAGR